MSDRRGPVIFRPQVSTSPAPAARRGLMGPMTPGAPSTGDPEPSGAAPGRVGAWTGPLSSSAGRAQARADAPAAEDPRADLAAGDPSTTLTRVAGAVVAGSAAVLALSWFVVPFTGSGPGSGPSVTLAQATLGSYEDTGVALQCALALALGLAGALRPSVGPGVVAMAALPLPWLLRFNPLALGSERPAVLVLLTSSATMLAVGAALAVVAAARAARRRDVGPTSAGAVEAAPSRASVPLRGSWARAGAVWVVGVAALAGTAGLGWYRLVPVAGVTSVAAFGLDVDPQGGILGIGSWQGRGSIAGLVLATGALGLAVAGEGVTRRAGGWALVALLVAEAVRRGVLPAEELSPFLVPGAVTIELLPLGLLVPLVGAGVGAWLALGPEPGAPDLRVDQVEVVPDPSPLPPTGPPSTGPPAAWPTASGS